MICENPDCRTNEMKPDFIIIKKLGERTIYYCSQRCFSKTHKVKFVYGKQSIKSNPDWSKIYMGGY